MLKNPVECFAALHHDQDWQNSIPEVGQTLSRVAPDEKIHNTPHARACRRRQTGDEELAEMEKALEKPEDAAPGPPA